MPLGLVVLPRERPRDVEVRPLGLVELYRHGSVLLYSVHYELSQVVGASQHLCVGYLQTDRKTDRQTAKCNHEGVGYKNSVESGQQVRWLYCCVCSEQTDSKHKAANLSVLFLWCPVRSTHLMYQLLYLNNRRPLGIETKRASHTAAATRASLVAITRTQRLMLYLVVVTVEKGAASCTLQQLRRQKHRSGNCC